MSIATHTPGPWEHVKAERLSHDAPGYDVTLSPGGILSAGSEEEGPTWVIEGEIDFLPDANLIAAAPDLFAAIQKFASHYPCGVNPFLDEAYVMARRAIAKAEGRS